MAATAPDLTEFYKYSRPKRRPCQIGFALDLIREGEEDNTNKDIKKGDAKKLVAALAQDKNLITGSAIITWLEKRAVEVVKSSPPITTHRKRTCTCYDD